MSDYSSETLYNMVQTQAAKTLTQAAKTLLVNDQSLALKQYPDMFF